MAADHDRFSTAARLKALGGQAAAKVYRARPKRRGRLTGRAALLALVVCSLVVALAYPMRQWVSQRSEIAEQERKAENAREAVEELRDRKARWQDPAYVEQQVRERLHYLRPGETGYIVPDGAGDAGSAADGTAQRSGHISGEPRAAGDRPWYRDLWDGVDRADARG
ncbi:MULTISPECIES: septum formation initiator family protein [unclassified Streptomyces]|uniref:FtsB family cell division protein n=1 Tax=unclassified Streptomyces TaxID=2593676 RepID=UPI000BF83737|nr:septum formation initiator family protein [Streptomyces sp. Ru87]PGH50024.1 acyl-phosphate glycerol 3-phosphate acyltransferase [Streptomyces sp. Ru87]